MSLEARIVPCKAEDTVEIRHNVLWPNHPIEHVLLPDDAHGLHFALVIDEHTSPSLEPSAADAPSPNIIGVISFFEEPLPTGSDPSANALSLLSPESAPNVTSTTSTSELSSETSLHALRFRKFAVLPSYQGRGLGSRLLLEGLQLALASLRSQPQSAHISYLWCDARESARAFYEQRGMRELLVEGGKSARFFKGDIPYLRMVMDVPV